MGVGKSGAVGRLVVVGNDWYNEDCLVTAHNWQYSEEMDFAGAYEFACERTGLGQGPKWRSHVAMWAARSCSLLPGDFVELGVGKGWTASVILWSLPWRDLGKQFWLFDRFEDYDVDPVTGSQLASRNTKGTYSSSLSSVERTFAGTPNIQLIQESLPESLVEKPRGPVAFIHADLNAAIPEAKSVETLWDDLVVGGIVLFDDFAYRGYSPQYESTLKLAETFDASVLSLPTGQGLVIKN